MAISSAVANSIMARGEPFCGALCDVMQTRWNSAKTSFKGNLVKFFQTRMSEKFGASNLFFRDCALHELFPEQPQPGQV